VGVVALLAAIVLALHLSSRLTRPIRELATVVEGLGRADFTVQAPEPSSNDELGDLARAFNRMARQLDEHERRLKATNAELEQANQRLSERNAGYLNMLGFVSHELKNVLGTITWSAQSLDDGLVGPLKPPQAQLVHAIRTSTCAALDMSRNYLDLARLESGRLEAPRALRRGRRRHRLRCVARSCARHRAR
jgi:signal transduction histidine kinase